jgi:hypothetical protein
MCQQLPADAPVAHPGTDVGVPDSRSGPAQGRRCRGCRGRCKSVSEKSKIRGCRGGRHLAARINARFSSVSKVSRLFPPGWKPSSTSGRMPDATFYRRAIIVLRDFELRSEKGLSSFHVPA